MFGSTARFCVCIFFFFFFFTCVFCFLRQITLFITVHGTHNHFIQKNILKMGPMVLFTYLKIILLQYFQFSIFNFNKNKLYPNISLSPLYNVVTNYFRNWCDKLLNHRQEIFEETPVTVQATSFPRGCQLLSDRKSVV